jgi:hypothetical protein
MSNRRIDKLTRVLSCTTLELCVDPDADDAVGPDDARDPVNPYDVDGREPAGMTVKVTLDAASDSSVSVDVAGRADGLLRTLLICSIIAGTSVKTKQTS